jgi:hypothetical protein
VLRPKKFRPFERRMILAIALLLIGAGLVGVILAIGRSNWRMLIASVGVLGLAVVYALAVRRGKPL